VREGHMRILGSTRSRSGTLMLLAPSEALVPETFPAVDVNPKRHEGILAQLQRLRGSVYLHDGAITPEQLSPDGRHVLGIDSASWHMVSVQPDGRVTGCARYRAYGRNTQPEHLTAWRSALANDRTWRGTLHMALESEIALARKRKVDYVEVGGWAIAEDMRFTMEAMNIALSTYALARSIGGAIGLTTATVRNCSSRILRKIGGRSLGLPGCPLPSYFDPHYGCEMELLRFDSNTPNPKYRSRIDDILSGFFELPVVCARAATGLVYAIERPRFVPLPALREACA
jgi:hypothetical protein